MNDSEMRHWQHELGDFEAHLAKSVNATYRSWQPTKWQSLESLRDILITKCWDGDAAGGTALELGCGSATLLLQLAKSGVRTIGVDRDDGALRLARLAANSEAGPTPDFVAGDFFSADVTSNLPTSDLVFHIGVIEHLDPDSQFRLLELSARLSNRWILIAIPNESSPVFQSFIRRVAKKDRVYDDPHLEVDVIELVSRAGYVLERVDGLHVFFSNPRYYCVGDSELDAFYERLRLELMRRGGIRYDEFPNFAFTPEDIPTLRNVEESLDCSDRLRFGFIKYFLIDKQPTAETEMIGPLANVASTCPHQVFGQLRKSSSVIWDQETASWYVLGYETVSALLRDKRLSARGVPASLTLLPPSEHEVIAPVERFLARWLVFSDPPKHAAVRRLVAPALNRAAFDEHVANLPSIARELLESLSEGGDLLTDVAIPLSLLTANRIMGTTPEEANQIGLFSEALIEYLATPGMSLEHARSANAAIEGLRRVVSDLYRRGSPLAVALHRHAESNNYLEVDDIVAIFAQILTGTVEPLSTAMVSCMLQRQTNGSAEIDFERLIESALSEEPPFHFAPRVASVNMSIEDVEIQAGQRVVLNLLSANDEPRSKGKHLSFGAGSHYCLGAGISRAHLLATIPVFFEMGLHRRIQLDRVQRRAAFGATRFEIVPFDASF